MEEEMEVSKRSNSLSEPSQITEQESCQNSLLTTLPLEMLDKIMGYLTLPSLKSLRQVNLEQNSIATSYLCRTDLCIVRLRCHRNQTTFLSDKSRSIPLSQPTSVPAYFVPPPHNQTLDDLTQCLTTSSRDDPMPCTHYQFRGGDLGTLAPQQFFSAHGHTIKTLIVKFEKGGTSKKVFYDIVQNKVPHMEALKIFNIGSLSSSSSADATEVSTEKEEDLQLSLPHLKSLTLGYGDMIGGNSSLVQDLFMASPNLEHYDGPSWAEDVKHIDVFKSSAKIHTIKIFTFEPHADNLRFYAQLASTPNFELKSLKIFRQHSRMQTPALQAEASDALSKILLASNDSLRNLGPIEAPLCFLRDVVWPSMKGVSQLSLNLRPYFFGFQPQSLDNSSFQRWLNPAIVFPSLTTIHLDGFTLWSEWQRSLSLNYFPFLQGSLGTVKRLCLQKSVPHSWLPHFPAIFPNVTHLSWGEIRNFPEVAEFLWNLKEVREMELQLNIGEDYPENSYPKLDAAFIGVEGKTCKGLKEGTVGWTEGLRIKGSILKAERLRELKIVLRDTEEKVKEQYELLSGDLTGLYGLKNMDQLCMRVHAVAESQNATKLEESLQSMTMYAHLSVKLHVT